MLNMLTRAKNHLPTSGVHPMAIGVGKSQTSEEILGTETIMIKSKMGGKWDDMIVNDATVFKDATIDKIVFFRADEKIDHLWER